MSGADGKPRRRILVDGEAAEPRAAPPRSVVSALGLDADPGGYEGRPVDGQGRPLAVYGTEELRAFLAGNLTLGDLEGIAKEEQYKIAEIGFGCLNNGKLDEAEKIFGGLLALDPFDAYFNTALGSIAHRRGRSEEAEQRYTRALEINPYAATALAHRGEIRIMSGRLGEGVQDLVRALQVDEAGAEPATHRARATLRALKEQLGGLDRVDLEQRAEEERRALAETEAVIDEALRLARAPDTDAP